MKDDISGGFRPQGEYLVRGAKFEAQDKLGENLTGSVWFIEAVSLGEYPAVDHD